MAALILKLVDNKGSQSIQITIKNHKRLTQYGFGLFLENVKPGEVAATQEARDAILAQPERSGLQGMDFWADNRIGFCEAIVPLNRINVPKGAKAWIKKFEVVK